MKRKSIVQLTTLDSINCNRYPNHDKMEIDN